MILLGVHGDDMSVRLFLPVNKRHAGCDSDGHDECQPVRMTKQINCLAGRSTGRADRPASGPPAAEGPQARPRVAALGQCGGEVDLDELAAVAQRGDSEQCAGGGEGRGEWRGVEVMPGASQDGAVGRDHVNDGADDVLWRGAGSGQDRQGVRHHLVDLGAQVARPDNLFAGVQGAQAREMGGAARFGDRQVGVTRGRVKTFRVNEDEPIGHDDHPVTTHAEPVPRKPAT